MYVLDTNSLIYFFKGEGNIGARILATPPDQFAVPSVVVFEIEYGIAKSRNPKNLTRDLASFLRVARVANFDYSASVESAKIRAHLERSGKPIGPYNLLIAGITTSIGGILITRNTSEFARVQGLEIEDWF